MSVQFNSDIYFFQSISSYSWGLVTRVKKVHVSNPLQLHATSARNKVHNPCGRISKHFLEFRKNLYLVSYLGEKNKSFVIVERPNIDFFYESTRPFSYPNTTNQARSNSFGLNFF